MITKEQVTEKLKTIIDPELNVNIVDLGLVYDIAINQEKGKIEVTMTLTTPGCPLSFVFEEWIPEAVKKIEGVKDVRMNLVWEPPWDPDKMSDDAKELMGIIR
ncbi:MAG: metal-sulfur cluster assembly factor [bacterium]|nr:metal-sulfur cluster assembly factor [bacterium]